MRTSPCSSTDSTVNSRVPVDAGKIVGVFAGLRPLVGADPELDTIELSREHAIASPMPGMSAISGGKYTTYRVMAAQLVDTAVADLALTDAPGSTTDSTPMLGAEGYASLWRDRYRVADEHGLPVAALERLLRRYGSCSKTCSRCSERPGLPRPRPDPWTLTQPRHLDTPGGPIPSSPDRGGAARASSPLRGPRPRRAGAPSLLATRPVTGSVTNEGRLSLPPPAPDFATELRAAVGVPCGFVNRVAALPCIGCVRLCVGRRGT